MALARIADLNGPPAEVAAHIEQAKQLSALYDDYIALVQDGHDRAPGIHASELYPCMRQAYYSVTGVARKPNVSKFWKQRFKMGTHIHLMVQEDFHALAKRSQKGEAMRVASAMAEEMDCSIEFEDELTISPKHQQLAAHYKIYSHCDGVFTFRNKTTGEVTLRVGLEIKSEAPDGYEKLKEPKHEHVRQAHIYMACLDLPLMWFFYMNKGNQNNTKSEAPYLITWRPDVWAELEQRIMTVHDYVDRGETPPRNETIVCEFCAWSYTCQPSAATKSFRRPPTRRETIRKGAK